MLPTVLLFTSLFLSTISCWGVFRSRVPPPSTPDVWIKSLGYDSSLNGGAEDFAPLFEIDEAYETALAELGRLSSRSSCHKIASESLLGDCKSIRIDSEEDENSRILFGVQLAACEFEVDGLEFPFECRRFEGVRDKRVRSAKKCLRKLAQKSQWWTSYSNNRANGFSMCSAARREVEREEMINVHRNITKTHKSLFAVIEVSLKDAWRAAKVQTEATAKLKTFIEELVEDYKGAKIDLAEDSTKMAEIMSGNLERLYERGQAAVNQLESSINKVRIATDQQVNLVDQTFDSISSKMEKSLEKFRELDVLAENHVMKFDAISGIYGELAGAHQTLTESSEKLVQIMENVTETLADMDEKVRSWEERISKLGHSAWLPLASFLLGGVILGRGWGGLSSVLCVAGGCFILLNTLQWRDFIYTQRFEVFSALWPAVSQKPFYILYFTSGLFLSACCGIACILYRRAASTKPLLG
ncbi:Tht1-like nuclear fusion protein-domain-containing protein [Tuber indicum]|nr:Tht1-like nuclear fusion protein-domain-containing protein [Tuber indicum]